MTLHETYDIAKTMFLAAARQHDNVAMDQLQDFLEDVGVPLDERFWVNYDIEFVRHETEGRFLTLTLNLGLSRLNDVIKKVVT